VVEAVIEAVRINVVNDQHVVILKEATGPRVVPIWIGPDVAHAIAIVLRGDEVSRPMTHDLLRATILEMGGTIHRAIINDLKDSIFFAIIEVDQDGRRLQIDARSSDALALAVRAQCPIFVEEHVLDQAGFAMPTEEGDTTDPTAGQQPEPIDNERLSVFREFINNLDIDDPKREN
jgi:bifunctional DNase/RNase